MSLSTGYDYTERNDEMIRNVYDYFVKLHPVNDQLEYVLRMLSRQLYGDGGYEYLHIHYGVQGKAGGGKTKNFEIMHYCLGDYIQKFDVSLLVNEKRKDSSCPKPEYKDWKGRRILYCTEPNPNETLHSGLLKELTGGEQIKYRMLFSNIYHSYNPQFKIHIMTNDLPHIDGADEGIRRRIRVLPYISTFKPNNSESQIKSETAHVYVANTDIARQFMNPYMKMAYMHLLFQYFNKSWSFEPTKTILENSQVYLSENNDIEQFVDTYLVIGNELFVTLQELKQLKRRTSTNCSNLRTRLERILKISFINQKKIKGKVYRSVLMGYGLKIF